MTFMPRLEKTTIRLLTPTRNSPLRPPPTRVLILLLLLLLLWTLLPVVLSPRLLQSSTSPQRPLIHTLILTLIHTLILILTHTLQPTLLPLRIPPFPPIRFPLAILSPPYTREPTHIALPTLAPAHFRLLHSSIPLLPCPSVQTVSPFTRNTQHLPRSPVMQVYTMLGP